MLRKYVINKTSYVQLLSSIQSLVLKIKEEEDVMSCKRNHKRALLAIKLKELNMEYEKIIEKWLRDFIQTMDDGILEPGDRSGDEPLGVKIIFDGYGYNDETDEQDNYDILTFAVFVHKNSLSGEEFPDHEFTPWALIHRPKEEVCIYAYYKKDEDYLEVLSFEEENHTELDHQFIYQLIKDIDEENYL